MDFRPVPARTQPLENPLHACIVKYYQKIHHIEDHHNNRFAKRNFGVPSETHQHNYIQDKQDAVARDWPAT